MKKINDVFLFTGLVTFLFLTLFAAGISAQTTEFTYQGRLLDNSLPPTANYDFEFSLWDALANGNQQGTTQTVTGVAVASGIFTVRLNFGAQFTGAARFLQIAVRPAGGPAYAILAPRQPITAAPHAIRSTNAGNADTAGTAGNVTGVVAITNGGTGSSTKNFVDLSTSQIAAGDKTFTGAISVTGVSGVFNGNGSGLTNINGANITNNTINASALNADTFPNNRNLSRLGSLRWDLLNQRVTVGDAPFGSAFDGTHLWVANNTSGNVSKIRVSDDVVVGTFTVGTNPRSVVFDGTHIWATNLGGGVTKLLASDGTNLGTFPVGASPRGAAFDGTHIWVANTNTDTVTRIRASDGSNQGSFATGDGPWAVMFDGTNIWVANNFGNNVTKLRASDGFSFGNFAVGTNPVALAYDGANIWVANSGASVVTKLRAYDGGCVATCNFAAGVGPAGVAFDGVNIWVAAATSGLAIKMRPADGVQLAISQVDANPVAITFDGANVWVISSNTDSVMKLPAFP